MSEIALYTSRLAALRLLIVQLALILPVTVYAELELDLKSNSPANTYVNGEAVNIEVFHPQGSADLVEYHWQDYQGKPLSGRVSLDQDGDTDIRMPEGAFPPYMGLIFTPADNTVKLSGREPGEPAEFGFAFLPEPLSQPRSVDPELWMGVVHANLDDPWLGGWMKTMTWRTTSAKWWNFEMDRRRAKGFIELPIISGSAWKSDDDVPVSAKQLRQLRQRVTDYFAADPATLYWETGIEENLRSRFETPFYFDNLKAKSDVVRQVADEVNPDVQLLFQIANMRYQDVGVFMRSEASRNYDILALHPYKWPDFPPVEGWLDGFLDDVNVQMKASGRILPIWVTEIGAPHQGNAPGKFFGYPKKQKSATGLSRAAMVSYIVKFHVLSHHHGVAKVFWYNYRDRGADREYAEDHFGLIDYWGYPKPGYPAYVNLFQALADKSVGESWRIDNIWAYGFEGDADVIVAWSYPAKQAWLDLAQLNIDTSSVRVRITNALGKEIALDGQKVRLTDEPVFIEVTSIN